MPTWVPRADGVPALWGFNAIDQRFWYNGSAYFSSAPWLAAFGATLTSPASYYVDSDGLLKLSGTNVLRLNHDPVTGTPRGFSFHGSVVNLVVDPRDLTTGNWTPTNVTPTKDATGPDGVANSATRLAATAGNGTISQSITSASAARATCLFIKRLVGSGTIQLSIDGGSTYNTLTITGSWARVRIPVQTVLNPQIVFRIVTSGDEIAVDFVQLETGVVNSLPQVGTRSANDVLYSESVALSLTGGALLAKTKFFWPAHGSAVGANHYVGSLSNGASTPYLAFNQRSGDTQAARCFIIGTSPQTGDCTIGNIPSADTFYKSIVAFDATSFTGAVGGTETGTPDTTVSLPSALTRLGVGSLQGAGASHSLGGDLAEAWYFPFKPSQAARESLTAS